MLDTFEILTTSGVVLWSKSYAPISANIINGLITNVFIEERVAPGAIAADASATSNPPYRKDKYTLKWTTFKDLGLIFVAVYQSLLHLSWIDKLLDNVKTIFVDLYKDQLRKPHTTVVECHFDEYFDQQIRELEGSVGGATSRNAPPAHFDEQPVLSTSGDETEDVPPPLPGILKAEARVSSRQRRPNGPSPALTPETSRPASPAAGHLLSAPKGAPGGRTSRRARKAAANTSTHASSGEESEARRSIIGKNAPKRMRKWDMDGLADEEDGNERSLDYSTPTNGASGANGDTNDVLADGLEAVSPDSWGKKTGKGEFVLRDLDDEVHSILSSANAKSSETHTNSGIVGSSLGAIGGLFRNVVGGKVLTKEDLDKPMRGMEEHLLKKNVAREAAATLCSSVESSLVGVKTGSFQTIESTIRTSMETSLRRTLTPTTSLDLLRQISTITSPPPSSSTPPRPYVISIVGVNGVGKSTSLSKIAYFLLQNNHSILIAACDTFRSGAVEQLRVHARNLSALTARSASPDARIELYERGYGKDAAGIARDAVSYAASKQFSIVLIDTAGRRHNDARLMSSLEKFANTAKPDKILMVGEALVGTDSVQQARNFNAAFGAGRRLDGFLISKCDTVGEMMGTLVSMVFATGIPVVFLGTGQHYSDLRTLNVGWAVGLLMS